MRVIYRDVYPLSRRVLHATKSEDNYVDDGWRTLCGMKEDMTAGWFEGKGDPTCRLCLTKMEKNNG